MTSRTPNPAIRDAYTPGPWEYGTAANYCGFYVSPKGTLPTLAAVERCGTGASITVHNFPGSTEANARLIAAAPDLLDALRACLLFFSDGHALSRFDWGKAFLRAEDIRELNELPGVISKAIAAAEGR